MKIGNHRLLGVADLPNLISIYGQQFQVTYTALMTGEVRLGNFVVPLENFVSIARACCNGFLLFIQGYTFSISFRGTVCYLFDSHSRDSSGRVCNSENGTSVLLQFRSVLSLQNYISNLYCVGSAFPSVYFQLQPVQVVCSAEARTSIQRLRKTNSQKKHRANLPVNRKITAIDSTSEGLNIPCRYTISKVVQGGFCQSNEAFGSSAGLQCAANSLFSICWSYFKDERFWLANDLDTILNHGDSIYKDAAMKIGNHRLLGVADLPNLISIYGQQFQVTYTALMTGEVRLGNFVVPLENFVSTARACCIGFLLFIQGYTFSISFRGTLCYLFDSHSRDSSGRVCNSENGTSVLLQFRSVLSLQNYISDLYCVGSAFPSVYFQLQPVQVICSADARTNIQRLRKANSLKKHRANLPGKRKLEYIDNQDKITTLKRSASKAEVIKETVEKSIGPYNVQKSGSNRRVKSFLKQIWQGPFYICVICNRSMYWHSVQVLDVSKYTCHESIFTEVVSFDSNKYICKTCNLKLLKKKVPCQAVANKLSIASLPPNIANLRNLERILVARRILFKKIAIMHGKGEFMKIKGTICNVPVDSDAVCDVLPRGADSNGITLVKLKRKLQYKGHVQFEPVRPKVVLAFLDYLKANNFLYYDVVIDPDKLYDDCFKILSADLENPIEVVVEGASSDIDDSNDPLEELRIAASEVALISTIPNITEDDNFIIAPGEGTHPIPLIGDQFCEELAHPHLFPTGKFGYKVERDIELSPIKYFNQRLLNFSQKFASDADFIFFARSVHQQISLQSSISIALQKVKSTSLTAGCLNNNFDQSVKSFIAKDDAYSFMSSVKGTPAYWKKFLYEVLAMVKQLGLPSYFVTLSCADLWWNELPSHINILNNLGLSKEDITNLSYKDRCKYLNENHVFLARHFQFRVQTFFKEILLNGPLGKTKYYAYRVEFQARGSPHIHAFVWIQDFPELTKDTKQEYLDYLDQIVSTSLPDLNSNPSLFEFVKTFQIHHHSNTCWKYKNSKCRFHFGKFFTEQTIIAEPLTEDLDTKTKDDLLSWRAVILDKVKNYIDLELNPSKKNVIDPTKNDFEDPISIDNILAYLDITKNDYYKALSISKDSDFEIHFKRQPNSCFVNNYFHEGLMAWQANIDIQPVFNHYKAVTYMCSYFSNSENECSEAMKQAAREAFEDKLSHYQQMKNVARAYSTKRECSIQEAVYHCLPELSLRKIFPKVIFANSNLPDQRYNLLKSKKDIKELPSDSKDIFKRSNLDRYIERPNLTFNKGKYAMLNTFCFAEFLGYHEPIAKTETDTAEYQPDILSDEVIEKNHNELTFPKKIQLMESKQKMKLRKVRKVVRYYVPRNKEVFPEKFAHHLLILFFPFRKESDLLAGNPPSYCTKVEQPGVRDIINENKAIFEPYAELVDSALNNYRQDSDPSFDAEGQLENTETDQFNLEADDELDTATPTVDSSDHLPPSAFPAILQDSEICKNINSLNKKQRYVFDEVFQWARNHMKSLSCKQPYKVKPIHIFLSGSGGVGKSHVIKTIYQSVTKTLLYHANDPQKPRGLLLAPTGVAAINIDGTTIHSGLGIAPSNKIQPLGDKKRCSLRNTFSEVKLIIIDEISMVSRDLFYQVHQRLIQIFACKDDSPFGGISFMVCGDLYQLPPVKGKAIYTCSKGESMYDILVYDLWNQFKFIELTQIMRQNNTEFSNLLNRVRIGKITDTDVRVLKQHFITTQLDTVKDALHIFAENSPVHAHNHTMLLNINEHLYTIDAIDKIPTENHIPQALITAAQNQKQQETGGLASKLELKIGARVMLTVNIDVSDKLVNGLIGTVKHFKLVHNCVKLIYIHFDCDSAGIKNIREDQLGLRNHWVRIEKTEAQIKIHKYKMTSPVIKRTQFPIALSWACTVHKVQGLSLPQAVISFTLHKQKYFNPGQMYVALSRVTCLEGLHLTGEFNSKAIKVNKAADDELHPSKN